MNDLIQPSAFDTTVLGIRVGKAVVDGLDRPLAERLRSELMASDRDVLFIRDRHFQFERVSELPWTNLELADVKLILAAGGQPPAPGASSDFTVDQNIGPDDGPALVAMARSIARLSRFHRCFGEAAAVRLYDAWLHNALAKQAAEWCFVARHVPSGEAAGLIAVTRDEASADLALVATADAYRSRGVLKQMTVTALRFLHGKGIARATVATQISNNAALRAYQAMDFSVEGAVVDFHMSRGR